MPSAAVKALSTAGELAISPKMLSTPPNFWWSSLRLSRLDSGALSNP
ncbi:hypothetical protein [Haloechinothrix alba]|nr:hypothetical protein [Haloechinothrix alba]